LSSPDHADLQRSIRDGVPDGNASCLARPTDRQPTPLSKIPHSLPPLSRPRQVHSQGGAHRQSIDNRTMEARLQEALDRRQSEGTLRSLKSLEEVQQQESSRSIDFSSNDYLGLARSAQQQARVEEAYSYASTSSNNTLGATGSRLLSGDSVYCRRLEEWLAHLHHRPAALVCNSGYDANLCVTSCLPVDVIIMDELCHNSIVMGVRWNNRQKNTVVTSFLHNDTQDLERTLQEHRAKVILVVVESVYSMDGDVAPLREILNIAQSFGAQVVVDEAHGLGIYGRTNRRDLMLSNGNMLQDNNANSIGGTGVLAAMELESHPALFASVHTFGKAAGCHGAVLCCSSRRLRDYLLNYARPFIYSTALPMHSLVTMKCSYETMISREGEERRRCAFALVRLFRQLVDNMLGNATVSNIALCPSDSPIQALLVPGNDICIEFCRVMQECYGILLYPIRAPTVARGQERVRIILHAHNTSGQVSHLVECMDKTLQKMRLVNDISSRL